MIGGDHKYTISPEEYIFAALAIYLDIINIFMYILRSNITIIFMYLLRSNIINIFTSISFGWWWFSQVCWCRKVKLKRPKEERKKNSKSQLCKIYLLFVRIILQLCRYWYIHYVTCPIKPFQCLVLGPIVDQMSPNVDILLMTELISHSFKWDLVWTLSSLALISLSSIILSQLKQSTTYRKRQYFNNHILQCNIIYFE